MDLGGVARTVWFSDDFTPRLDWTWNNFYASAAIRFHCWQHCVCSTSPTRENTTSTPSTTKLWSFVKNHPLIHKSDGSYVYRGLGSNELQVLPPQNRLGTPASPGGADGRQFCSAPWQIPQTPPKSTGVYHDPSSQNLTVCGNTCNGPQDCGSIDPSASCFCALTAPDDAYRLGLDRLALASSVLVGSLGGRDVRRYVDEREEEYRCPCNGTFVAPECCGMEDGNG